MAFDFIPLWLTLKLAVITSGILFIISIPLAYWLSFSKNKLSLVFESLVSLPLVLPPTVIGFYILILFSPQHYLGQILESYFNVRVVFTFTGLVIGSVFFSLPFMVNPIKSGFQNLPSSLSEASYTLGKSRWETLWKVLLPNIKPSLLTGLVMSFAHTVGEFGVVLMIGGNIPGETKVASIAIFGEAEALNYASANFYSLILVISSFFILLLMYILNRKALRIL